MGAEPFESREPNPLRARLPPPTPPQAEDRGPAHPHLSGPALTEWHWQPSLSHAQRHAAAPCLTGGCHHPPHPLAPPFLTSANTRRAKAGTPSGPAGWPGIWVGRTECGWRLGSGLRRGSRTALRPLPDGRRGVPSQPRTRLQLGPQKHPLAGPAVPAAQAELKCAWLAGRQADDRSAATQRRLQGVHPRAITA